jgi:hypothetical protein
MAGSMWNNALKAVAVARKFGVNTDWYAKLKQAGSTRDRYHNGYCCSIIYFQGFCRIISSGRKIRRC